MSRLPALRRLQRWWLVWLAVLTAAVVALPFARAKATSLPAVLPTSLASMAGVAGLIAVLAVDRTFAAAPPSDDRQAMERFASRQAWQYVVSLAPAALGFLLTTVLGHRLAAATGLLFSVVALARAWPSEGRIRRIERSWSGQGHDVSILRAARSGDVSEDR